MGERPSARRIAASRRTIEGFLLVFLGRDEGRSRSRFRGPTFYPFSILFGFLTLCAKRPEEIRQQLTLRKIDIDSGSFRYEIHCDIGAPEPKTEFSAGRRRRNVWVWTVARPRPFRRRHLISCQFEAR